MSLRKKIKTRREYDQEFEEISIENEIKYFVKKIINDGRGYIFYITSNYSFLNASNVFLMILYLWIIAFSLINLFLMLGVINVDDDLRHKMTLGAVIISLVLFVLAVVFCIYTFEGFNKTTNRHNLDVVFPLVIIGVWLVSFFIIISYVNTEYGSHRNGDDDDDIGFDDDDSFSNEKIRGKTTEMAAYTIGFLLFIIVGPWVVRAGYAHKNPEKNIALKQILK